MSRLMNDRLEVGQQIAPPLRALEKDIESAFSNAGVLMSAIARGRLTARVPFEVSINAVEQINVFLASAVAGAKSIDALHKSFDVLRADMNLPSVAFGDHGDKPAIEPAGEVLPLRAAG